jgi:hypothetical protein
LLNLGVKPPKTKAVTSHRTPKRVDEIYAGAPASSKHFMLPHACVSFGIPTKQTKEPKETIDGLLSQLARTCWIATREVLQNNPVAR